MKKFLRLAGELIVMAAGIMVLCAVLLMNCKKDPAVSHCDLIKVSWEKNGISITYPESSCNCTTYNDVHDEFGHLLSFNFSMPCEKSSYSGKVFNITYELGDIISYDATINGESCHWEK